VAGVAEHFCDIASQEACSTRQGDTSHP